jgi:hypothetical protein
MIERKPGSLVLISSTCGVKPMARMPHYNAAEPSVMGLTKSLALDLGPYCWNLRHHRRGRPDNPGLPGLRERHRAVRAKPLRHTNDWTSS